MACHWANISCVLPKRDYVTWVLAIANPSVVCSVCAHCALLRGLKLSAIFLRHFVPWPSSDLRAKFDGDRPRGTPPSGATGNELPIAAATAK